MKTKILLSVMILLSFSSYSQSGIEKLEKQNLDLTWETFEKINKIKNVKVREGDVRRVTLDASTIDKDYDKITYIFLSDNLSHCIIEFKTIPTLKSLITKYGKYTQSKNNYTWLNDKKTMDIVYTKNYDDEVMISFGDRNYKNGGLIYGAKK